MTVHLSIALQLVLLLSLIVGILRGYEGNYSRYLDAKAQQMEAEEKQNVLFDKKLAEEEA